MDLNGNEMEQRRRFCFGDFALGSGAATDLIDGTRMLPLVLLCFLTGHI